MNRRAALERIAVEARRGELVFPSSVAVASRLRQALDDPDCHVDAAAKLIQADPLLSARVVALANSAPYRRGDDDITSVGAAVSRLGFRTVRTLAVALVARQMAGAPTLALHRDHASRLWEHTAHVAALSRMLARRVTQQDPETALFAGLMHEVGAFYLISRAKDYPVLVDGVVDEADDELEAAISDAVLQTLAVPESVTAALRIVWGGYLTLPPASLGDTVLLANAVAPVLSPFVPRAELHAKDSDASVDMALGKETLADILRESAEEVASLTKALRA
jgi:HD-like signal output (HDOD) protein